MDQNLLQLCLVKFIYLLQVFQVTTDTYQEIYYVIFRAQPSKTPPFWPKIQLFLQSSKAENETNGPKPVSTVSNQIYFPNRSDLADYRHLSRNKLGDFQSTIFKNCPFRPHIQPFLQAGKAENEANGPNPVASVSNQTYSPITSNLVD